MNLKLLEYFSEWFTKNRDLLAESNAVVELSVPSVNTDEPGIYADIDFDAGELLGRATLWATGECEMEALYSKTGNI